MTSSPIGPWDVRELATGSALACRVGPLRLWVARREHEWTVAAIEDPGASSGPPTVRVADAASAQPEDAELSRYVASQDDGAVRVVPVLADRPVVASPRTPLFVLPGEEATLFVGSPLWMRVEVGRVATALTEIAVHRPSDTWFGPPAGDGEMSYSTHTAAALDIDNVPQTTEWAVTPVIIRNLAADTLQVDKLKLPVPYLSVYAAGDRLWTEVVTMGRQEGDAMAVFDVDRNPPRHAQDAVLVSSPREVPDGGLLIRAFGGLFGSRNEGARV